MRSMPSTVLLGLVLATAAYASTADDAAPARLAGTLACSPVDKVSLVFGSARAATCTYVAEDRGVVQSYDALLPARADAKWARSQMLVWRVRTSGGKSRAGMLDGVFAAEKAGTALRGAVAELIPVGHDREMQIALGANDPRQGEPALVSVADRSGSDLPEL